MLSQPASGRLLPQIEGSLINVNDLIVASHHHFCESSAELLLILENGPLILFLITI